VAIHQRATWWVDGVSFAGNVVILAGAWWMGDAARRRHEEASAHRDRAEQLAAARQELARRAVAEERLRIARELHDVVAHTMSAIAVQAATGRVAFDGEPPVARSSLGQIETLAREALTEMRRLLTVLRTEPAEAELEAHRSPAASLADLDRVVATSRVAGLTVDVRIEGRGHALPAGVDLAAFRIVQEALTNVARHGRTDRAEVSICYGEDAVVVEIDNDGPPAAGVSDGGGMGIVGMRERAASCGGTLVAAAKPAGGFRVLARLLGGGTMSIRVAIADDQPLVVTGFAAMVRQTADLVVVGEASDGVAAVETARRERPDVFLMDVRMPRLDGIEATARITRDPLTTGVRVIILTTFDVDEGLFAAIRVVAAGEALLAPTVTRRLIEAFARQIPPVPRGPSEAALAALTDREREVLTEVGRGRSNTEIAGALHMSPATAKTHVGRVMAKLHARDRAQLVIAAYESGLINVGE
jgi:signal transduction histidine kinase/DNA-binding NarL/FixJ family response regulator